MDRKEYIAIHAWLRYKFGSANKCDNVNCKKESNYFEYALKNGFNYSRCRDNFTMLCKKCHIKYDGQKPELLHTLRNDDVMKRIQEAKYKPISQFDTDGFFIQNWKSATHAQQHTGISRTSIGNNLNGNSKTAGGYVWKIIG